MWCLYSHKKTKYRYAVFVTIIFEGHSVLLPFFKLRFLKPKIWSWQGEEKQMNLNYTIDFEHSKVWIELWIKSSTKSIWTKN